MSIPTDLLRRAFKGAFNWPTTGIRKGYTRSRKKPSQYSRIHNRINRIEQGKNKELNTLDTIANQTIPSTGHFIPLSELAEGTDFDERIGNTIQPRHLTIKGDMTWHATATHTRLRMIIFKDKDNHGAYPTVAQILKSVVWHAFPEVNARKRFKVYRDSTFELNSTQPAIFFKDFIKFGKKTRIEYSNTTAAEASNGKNALFALFISSEATYEPTVQFGERLRFVD